MAFGQLQISKRGFTRAKTLERQVKGQHPHPERARDLKKISPLGRNDTRATLDLAALGMLCTCARDIPIFSCSAAARILLHRKPGKADLGLGPRGQEIYKSPIANPPHIDMHEIRLWIITHAATL